jgi:AraC-like DNA-binding protein
MLPVNIDAPLLPSFSVRLMYQYLLDNKFDADRALKVAKLSRDKVFLDETLVTTRQEMEFQKAFANLTAAHPDREKLWFEVGTKYKILGFGPYGRAFLTFPSLGDAWSIVKNGHAMTFTLGMSKQVYSNGKVCGSDLYLDNVPDDMKKFTICRDFGAARSIMDDMWDGDFPITEMTVDSDVLSDSSYARSRVAKSDRTQWRWPVETAYKAMRFSDEVLNQIFIRECEARLGREELSARVANLVSRQILAGRSAEVSITSIAREVGMHQRSLQRRLSEKRLSFRGLYKRAQMEAAEEMLATEMWPIAEVAFRVGYADVTAFTRAFRAQTGRTPGSYRREQMARG